jgi:hypothetical protein
MTLNPGTVAHDCRTVGLQLASVKAAEMPETRLERWLETMLARATTPRGAAIVIATASTSITVGAGILSTLDDRESYPSIGSGVWWAVQTVTTVGTFRSPSPGGVSPRSSCCLALAS